VVRHTLGDRVRYAFDNVMARGTTALVAGLFVASALLILGVAMVVMLLGGLDDDATAGLDFIELLWLAMLRTLDPGTMADDAGSLVFVLGMFTATLGGVLLVAILIGLVTSGIEGRLTELRRGRSRVIESEHTVILGWSPQTLTLVEELVEANASRGRATVCVLAEADKVEMEEELRARIPNRRTTRIVCRSGSTIEPSDIDIASPQTARSIVVLGHGREEADADVIKSLLAISNSPTRREAPYNLVAEIHDPGNAGVARLAARNEVRVVVVGELIGRIAAQACRQPGLSVVYEELLDFGGDEIYFSDHLGLDGQSFGDALHEFEDSVLVGLAPADGRPRLNPPMETVIGADDRLILLATDESTIRRGQKPDGSPDAARIGQRGAAEGRPERTLVLGWNRRAASLLRQLDGYVVAGSEALVVSPHLGDSALFAETAERLTNTRLASRAEETTSRQVLESLLEQTWDRAVILAHSDQLPPAAADARTLVTLLHLRDILSRGDALFSIVTEMLDLRNRDLAQVTRADDFIVSEKLVSQMLAQLSENPQLEDVFADLFDVDGSEIYLRPASDFLRPSAEPVDFYTVTEAARRQSAVAIGYRLMDHAEDAARGYGIALNPRKSEPIALGPADRVIVLAEG
jgi:ion channel POLLUX/CASTOR